MNTIRQKNSVNKVISVVIVYALLLNEMIPFARAMETIEFVNFKTLDLNGSVAGNNLSENNWVEPVTNTNEIIHSARVYQAMPSLPGLPSTGPGQAETGGFSIGTTDGMVNKFTGDFAYSIPLMDVEGYPIVLSYNSNVTMLQEASWVGLGWDLNVGAISREMRGIPDEFNGSQDVVTTHNELDNWTNGGKDGAYFALSGGTNNETGANFAGGGQVTLLFGKYEDNYLGLGKTVDFGLGGQFSISSTGDHSLFLAPNFNVGFNYDSKGGIGTSQSVGVSAGYGPGEGKSGAAASGELAFGKSSNSRYGLLEKSISFGASAGYTSKSQTPDEKGGLASYQATSSITYGTATMIPRVQFSSTNGSSDNFQMDMYLKLKTGGGLSMKIGYIGQDYTSESFLDINSTNHRLFQPAYGYMHSGKRKNDNSEGKYPIMDFNRGNDSEFSEEMKNLPFSVQTHDIFYLNASGLGATFRPQRKDYGTYYDPRTESLFNKDSKILSDDDQTNVAIGIVYDVTKPNGIGFGIGYESGTMKGDVNSGEWKDGSMHILEFSSESASSSFDNSVYFRSVGESTPVDMTAWNAMNGNTADYFDVNDVSNNVAQSDYLKISQTNVSGSSLNNQNQPTYSATVFNPRTAASLTGNDATYKSWPLEGSMNPSENIPRQDASIRATNHISAVDVVSPQGVRYRFGVPAYNYSSSEVSFAVGENQGNGVSALPTLPNEGMVVYSPGVNSVNNTHGRSNYFDKTEVPPYAHSFLLTEMTSSDYIDRTDDGPTLDDIGTWYKFNHTRLYKDTNPYKWRFPMSGGTDAAEFPQASLAKGVLGSTLDDMGHYSYGEKEIWYTHSVESKNFIAVFYLSDRNDMYSVLGEDGVLDESKPLKKIDKIVLYNKSEWMKGNTSLPLQTVEFVYDYSLCSNSPGNPNTYSGVGQSGKLTLKQVRAFGGNSREAGLSGFTFDYGNGATDNPSFSYFDMDSWGNYKPNDPGRPNDVFPYAEQDGTQANANIQAWKLKAINNPAGGRIEVEYEADRYQTVQYKRAMRHFDVYGMVDLFRFMKILSDNTWTGSISDQLNFHHEYGDIDGFISQIGLGGMSAAEQKNVKKKCFKDGSASYMQKFGTFDLEAVPQNVIIFRLDQAIPGYNTISEASTIVKDGYFQDPSEGPNSYLRELFFKMHVNIKPGVQDIVPLMADISDDFSDAFSNAFNGYLSDDFNSIGVMPLVSGQTQYQYGYVIVDPVNTGDREEISGDGQDKVEKGSLVMNPLQLMSLQFARQYLLDKVYGSCNGCDTDLSIDWKVFFGQDMYEYMIKDGDYAQTFIDDYSTVRLFEADNVKFGGNARVKSIRYFDNWADISAKYDNGNLINPGEYDSDYTWNYLYTETIDSRPVESGVASFEGLNGLDENSLYYWDSYVNIKKKFPDERKFTPTPVAEQLYPVPLVGYKHVEVHFSGTGNYGHSVSKFHTLQEYKYSTKSRSTQIDNDTRIEKKNIITGKVTNLYGLTQGHVVETNDFHGKPDQNILYDNQGNLISKSTYHYYEMGEKVKMVDEDGDIASENIAIEYDMHADARYVSDKTKFNMAGLNFEFFYLAPASFSFNISPSFSTNSRERGFYSHALIKHINYSAVLKEITTEYLGSVNHAEHILYDKYSGEPILTSLNDEFNDKLYSMSYPSHWKFRNLRQLNELNGSNTSIYLNIDGTFDPYAGGNELGAGDRIFINGQYAYVAQNYPEDQSEIMYLINEDGTVYTPASAGSVSAIIINSNRDNRLTEIMQNVVSKTNPYDVQTNQLVTPVNVISSSAVNYRDKLNVACGAPCEHNLGNNNEITFNTGYNPYLYGIRGDLIVDGQYAWQDERSNLADLHGIRFDGTYNSFKLFYDFNPTENRWVSIDNPSHPENVVGNAYQNWRKYSDITVIDRFGKPLESRDQIGIYSSVIYGYSNKYTLVPIAQAVNARQSDIAYDGFEDYTYIAELEGKTCPPSETHFDFKETLDPLQGIVLSTEEHHSGLASLTIPANKAVTVAKGVSPEPLCTAVDATDIGPVDIVLDNACACIKPFEPVTGEYIIGAWIKQINTGAQIDVRIDGIPVSGSPFTPSGVVLDGWQRFEAEFTIPISASTISVSLINDNNVNNAYFDDIRIHPFLAGMTTVVYDPKSLLPLATHDGYNFTTFYNYDENLEQVRMRIETIEGIRTIVEGESGGQKNY